MSITGLNCKLYINTGTYAVPIWSEVDCVKDITVDLTPTEGDSSCRKSKFQMTKTSLIGASISGNIIYEPADSNFILIRDSLFAETDAGKVLELAAMDGDITESGKQGLRASWVLTQFGREEPLGDAVTVPITFKPTNSDNEPEWYIVP